MVPPDRLRSNIRLVRANGLALGTSRHNLVMHWVEVSGYQLPRPCSDHPALELCNTWAGWNTQRRTREYLLDYDRLAVWAGYAGLLDPDAVARLRQAAERDPAAAKRALTNLLRFRTAFYRVLVGPPDPDAFRLVAATAQKAWSRTELADGKGVA